MRPAWSYSLLSLLMLLLASWLLDAADTASGHSHSDTRHGLERRQPGSIPVDTNTTTDLDLDPVAAAPNYKPRRPPPAPPPSSKALLASSNVKSTSLSFDRNLQNAIFSIQRNYPNAQIFLIHGSTEDTGVSRRLMQFPDSMTRLANIQIHFLDNLQQTLVMKSDPRKWGQWQQPRPKLESTLPQFAWSFILEDDELDRMVGPDPYSFSAYSTAKPPLPLPPDAAVEQIDQLTMSPSTAVDIARDYLDLGGGPCPFTSLRLGLGGLAQGTDPWRYYYSMEYTHGKKMMRVIDVDVERERVYVPSMASSRSSRQQSS